MSPIDAVGRPQSVLLLGGTSDIGLAIVRRLVEHGARRVVLASRSHGEPRLPDGASVSHIRFEAGDTDGHGRLLEAVFAEQGDVDVVVVAFGVLCDSGRVERDAGAAVEMADVNVTGTISVLLHTARLLERQGHGTIVVLSSVAALGPRPSNFVYGSTKAAIDFLARGLGERLEGTGVRMMIVRPGFVRTKMTAGRSEPPLAVEPGRVAEAVIRALARDEQIVWVPRALRWVALGLRVLPRGVIARLDR